MFKIEKSHPAFPSFRWLLKAASTDKTRAILRLIRVEQDPDDAEKILFIATDGRRLHRVCSHRDTLPKIEPGNYSILKTTATEVVLATGIDPDTEEMNYPSWRQVIPTTSPEDPEKIVGDFKASKNLIVSSFTARCNGLTNENKARKEAGKGLRPQGLILFNDAFLADLLGEGTLFGAKDSFLWSFTTEHLAPLVIKSETGVNEEIALFGVLMPLRG